MASNTAARLPGSVKWFSPTKGFGFITPDNPSENDIFLHAKALEEAGIDPRAIGEGTRLRYSVVVQRDGRLNAGMIERVDAA